MCDSDRLLAARGSKQTNLVHLLLKRDLKQRNEVLFPCLYKHVSI